MHVYRNSTVEYLFKNMDVSFSTYDGTEPTDAADILICYMLPYVFSENELVATINGFTERTKYIAANYPDRNIYAITLQNYFYKPFSTKTDKVWKKINAYNELLCKTENIKVIDISPFYIEHEGTFDPKFYYTHNAIINPKLAKEFQNFLFDEIQMIKRTRKKCLVVDLDNTLWGGILGEDGIENLQISGQYPGNCFQDFQKMLATLKDQGVILGICSKNNYDDVVECFKKRDDLALSLSDFAVKRINWTEKRKNMVEIAEELNIGLDSIVFVDDSPVERANVQTLGDVTVLEYPDSPYLMTEFFAQEFRKHFGVYNLTADDKNKSAQYEYKAKSEQLRAQVANEDEFIKKLRIKIICEEMNQNNSERIAQLINKSNQFNLTTRRYEKNELVSMDNATILAIRVLDKFGDLGITGVAIAVKDGPDTARIDTFLMSCRVLGRKIEKEFLKIVLNRLYQDGVRMVNSEYIKTRKNALVQSFYDENGFRRVGEDGDIISYSYKLDKPVEYNKNYRIEVKNERQD